MTGHFLLPSNYHKEPSFSTKAIKWESTFDWTADWPWELAPLCYDLISLLFLNIYPLSFAYLFWAYYLNFTKYEFGSTISG